MASVIKAGVVASVCVLGRGRHVLVCASLRADINVSLFGYINAVKSLQASVRAATVRRGEGRRPGWWVKYGFGDQGRGRRVCVCARTWEARPLCAHRGAPI